ncbi:MAG: HAMP domain-containing protein, partial [Selenomonadaceae bacterium]|nr:HAMP domain-containing protein [Selenomonadaceae bacterium]
MIKLSIRGRVLLLVFASLLAAILAVGGVAFYGISAIGSSIQEQEHSLDSFLETSMGGYAEKQAKERLKEVATGKAQLIDRELMEVRRNVTYLSDRMSLLLQFPEHYLPRSLPDVQQGAAISHGMPYIQYSPALLAQGVDEALRREIGIAGNFADTLVLMRRVYQENQTEFFAGSKHGYMIALSSDPGGEEGTSFEKQVLEEYAAGFDNRQRLWYRLGEQVDRPSFTRSYRGTDGYLDVACVMPYYDKNGFAGVVGISYNTEKLYRSMEESPQKESHINFVLGRGGHVIFSSEQEGLLAAKADSIDLRESENPSIAELARRMMAGETDVTSIELNGEVYFLAFAPMPSIGWSFAAVIEDNEILDPVAQITHEIQEDMTSFRNILREIYLDSLVKTGLILLPILLLVFYGSGIMAARFTRPIRRLTDEVKEIAAGNFNRKLDVRTGDEIEHLADTFNVMTEKLKQYVQNMARAAAEKEHARTELEVAARIQLDMLPDGRGPFPERKEFDIRASMDPARDVGGDFYDFYLPDEGRLVITIADVSGKGVPAALFMAKSQSVLKNCVIKAKSSELALALEEANRQLCRNNEAAMFV